MHRHGKAGTGCRIGRPRKYQFDAQDLMPLNFTPAINNSSITSQAVRDKFRGISHGMYYSQHLAGSQKYF